MKMKWISILIVLKIFVFCTFAQADTQLVVTRFDKHFELHLKDIPWPKGFIDELDSGLNVKIAIICELTNENNTKHELDQIHIKVRYDLWNEAYNIDLNSTSFIFKTKKQLLDFFSDLPLNGLAKSKLKNGDLLNLIVLLNPIKDEKLEQIRKWISANSISIPISSAESKTRTHSYSPRGALFFYNLNRLEKFKENAQWSLQLNAKVNIPEEAK